MSSPGTLGLSAELKLGQPAASGFIFTAGNTHKHAGVQRSGTAKVLSDYVGSDHLLAGGAPSILPPRHREQRVLDCLVQCC